MRSYAFRGPLGASLAVLLSLIATAADARGFYPKPYGVSREVSACGVIRHPGAYVLVKNLTAHGDCLKVRADYVTIDLAGFVITGDGSGRGITDEGEVRTFVAVGGGTITGFAVAIDLTESPASRVTRMRIFANAGGGNDTLICDEGADIKYTAAGIVASSGSEVSGNIVRSNEGLGIFVGSGSRVVDNVLYNNGPGDVSEKEKTATGICAGSSSTITGNALRNNTGLALQAGSGSVVSGNAARKNGAGLFVNSGSTVSGNSAKDNDAFGISVNCPSNVIGNTAYLNGTDIVLDITNGSCNRVDNVPSP